MIDKVEYYMAMFAIIACLILVCVIMDSNMHRIEATEQRLDILEGKE